MKSMIRVHTFIKYCGIQLQESQAALEQEQHDICLLRAADAVDSLLKALAAAMPTVKKDLLCMEEKALARLTFDLASSQADATEAISLITQIRKARDCMSVKYTEDTKKNAQDTCRAAGRAFEIIEGFFK